MASHLVMYTKQFVGGNLAGLHFTETETMRTHELDVITQDRDEEKVFHGQLSGSPYIISSVTSLEVGA